MFEDKYTRNEQNNYLVAMNFSAIRYLYDHIDLYYLVHRL